ncbi:glycosyltransferase family 2 protein [Microvirga pudoricolor]|uniref:glycosyltransferase family 2 protein n=1 Tax=Microvirga pudoricolor TaxID=2778729 RepID=UPI001951662E|nr:hypothetical protein [Microvirga pudoricolor]MBM6594399.1 hypothetical protein [Microvirga pudoricolor]
MAPSRSELLAGVALALDQLGLPTDGETAIASPIGEDLLLVSGVTDAMPDIVPVLLNGDPALSMKAGVVTWPRPDAPAEARLGFVAIVPVKVVGRVRVRSIVMRRKGYPARYTLVRRALPLPSLMTILSQDAAAGFPQVADGVAQALISGKPSPKRLAAALAVLTAAARDDGFIEVMGALDTGDVFLQGWCNELPADKTRLLIAHDGIVAADFRSARVERQDLGGAGHGFAGILQSGEKPLDPRKIDRVFFRGKDGWHALDVYERRVHLVPTDVPAHIRDVLPRAAAGPDTITVLRRAGERFDGRDTVSTSGKPVRIGMDMVLELPSGGMLVGGWMLDPGRLVASVTLHAGGQSGVVDRTWTRLPRTDVTTSFQHDHAFMGLLDPQRHDHGFLAFVPGLVSAGGPVYFELSLGEDGATFYPLKPTLTPSRRALDRVMAALDPRSAAATMAIETHIGPMIQGGDHPRPSVVDVRDFGFDETASGTGLIVGGGSDAEEILITLSLLALDPDTCALPIIVSAPLETFGRIAAEVQRMAGFYGLAVRLVACEGAQDSCDGLEAATTRAGQLDAFLFLSAGVLPRQKGWFSLLEQAYRGRSGKALVSPTIVFEDNSICFAGTRLDPDKRQLMDQFLGYPRDVIQGAEPAEVIAGSASCCILSRGAFEKIGGFSRSYVSAKEKGRDLCLKLKLAGTPSVWLPDVEMVSADGSATGSGLPWQRLTQRVDRWSFDRRWLLLIANMRGAE